MDPFYLVQKGADWVVYHWWGLGHDTYLGSALNFFIYDVIKIGILLILINYIMAITRYYFPVKRAKAILSKRNWYGFDYLLAAFLGVVTPFCSCSSIPLFIGFISGGIPLGVTFSFLISSPLVNESSLYLFPAIFGWEATFLYNLVGIVISVLGGILIQKLQMNRFIKKDFLNFKTKEQVEEEYGTEKISFSNLWQHWTAEASNITKKVFPYVLLGVGLGALIHGYVPEDLIARYLSVEAWWTSPLAVLMGIPLYANSVSVIPVMEALVQKGIPLGSALAFMTATVTLSLPEALILKKVMKWQLLSLFFGITTVGIILIGYIFNFIY